MSEFNMDMFSDMWAQAKQELVGMWEGLDMIRSSALASDAIKRAAGTPENANMAEFVERSRQGGDPVVLDAVVVPPQEPQDLQQTELDLFEDSTVEESVVPVEVVETTAPQGFAPEPVAEEAQFAVLWGDAYHTKAGKDQVKLADYESDVAKYAKVGTDYFKMINPILLEVSSAFDGDEGVSKEKIHRAMLEIGAHESEGGSQLVNSDSTARGVFQVLAPTAKANAKTPYYGPKAQAIAGKTKAEVASMSSTQIKEWMRTNTKANAVMGTIELIKLSKAKGKLAQLK